MREFPSPENPFDVLPLGGQIRRENALVGLGPWVLLSALEWFWAVGVEELIGINPLYHMALQTVVVEVVLVPLVMGYAAQIHSIRTFENLCRRVRWEDIAVTPIRGMDILFWLEKNRQKALRWGILGNVFTTVIPITVYLSLNSGHGLALVDNRGLWTAVLLTVGIRLGMSASLSEIAFAIGFRCLFESEHYFRSRVYAFLIVIRVWLDAPAAVFAGMGALWAMLYFTILETVSFKGILEIAGVVAGIALLLYYVTIFPKRMDALYRSNFDRAAKALEGW